MHHAGADEVEHEDAAHRHHPRLHAQELRPQPLARQFHQHPVKQPGQLVHHSQADDHPHVGQHHDDQDADEEDSHAAGVGGGETGGGAGELDEVAVGKREAREGDVPAALLVAFLFAATDLDVDGVGGVDVVSQVWKEKHSWGIVESKCPWCHAHINRGT